MKIHWRRSAIHSLLSLDQWRKTIELPPIAVYLRNHINQNFQKQDFSVCVLGNAVVIDGFPVDLRMLLISVGKSDPYKVFYRLVKQNTNEIFLIRHPRQKPLFKINLQL
jgi:hypothetical protein